MKTKEGLAALKKEVEALNAKLAELTEEELAEVSGGISTSDTAAVCDSELNELKSYYTEQVDCTVAHHGAKIAPDIGHVPPEFMKQ